MKKRAAPQGPFVCYVLHARGSRRTYTGQTNNFTRRLRQHRGELAGGARYTRRRHGETTTWECMFRVAGFTTLRSVLQFERAMKRRRVRASGPAGRVLQLEYLLAHWPLAADDDGNFGNFVIECLLPVRTYLHYAQQTETEFLARRAQQQPRIDFVFVTT